MNEVLYVTRVINEVEAGGSSASSISDDDPGTSMDEDLAGLSEVVVNG